MISPILRRLSLSAGLLPLALLALAVPTRAQDPPPPPVRDTLAVPDTLDMPGDTLAARQDTVPMRPAVRFPTLPDVSRAGFGSAVWVWDREALLREAPVSLIDLLDRIPGISALRSGMFAQPEGAGAFGGSATRVEIERDGFTLDPLTSSAYDLSQIALGQLTEVRVERRLGLLRIRLRTEEPQDSLPYSRVEAGIGEPDANMFRGLFMAPHVIVGPVALGIERIDTDGLGRTEPASIFTGWGKWSWTDERRGVQLEMMRTTTQRQPDSPWPIEQMRQEIVLRARNRFAGGLTAEVYGGLVQFEEKPFQEESDTATITPLERDVVQAGIRAAWALPWGVVAGTWRYRDTAPLPSSEAILEADLGLGPVRLGGELGHASWTDRDATLYTSLRAEVGPFMGATAWGEMTGGERAAPRWGDSIPATVATDRSGWRAGLTLDLGRAIGSLGYVSMEGDRGLPFGLPFDSAGIAFGLGPARGIEARGRLIIFRDWLAIESWITDWQEAAGWPYMPGRTWRTALELHTFPLPSRNLEILARFEGSQRGGMLAYPRTAEDPDGGDGEGNGDDGVDPGTFAVLPPFTTFAGYLQIRVIDVRAFIRWEDILAKDIEVLPGVVRRGPRIFYGVKWNLWN